MPFKVAMLVDLWYTYYIEVHVMAPQAFVDNSFERFLKYVRKFRKLL